MLSLLLPVLHALPQEVTLVLWRTGGASALRCWLSLRFTTRCQDLAAAHIGPHHAGHQNSGTRHLRHGKFRVI